MIGFGFLLLALGVIGIWLMRRNTLEQSKRYLWFATWMIGAPFLANSFGWIFTEMGRQPWVVNGLMKTADGVSPIGTGYIGTSLLGFTALYSVLAIVEISLMFTLARRGPAPLPDATTTSDEADRPAALVY